MKYVVYMLLSLMFLSGCVNSDGTPKPEKTYDGLPIGIGKFSDGDVTCWTSYQNSISCLRGVK